MLVDELQTWTGGCPSDNKAQSNNMSGSNPEIQSSNTAQSNAAEERTVEDLVDCTTQQIEDADMDAMDEKDYKKGLPN